MTIKIIHCCGCEKQVFAEKKSGEEIYKHREDLKDLILWQCPFCELYVGSHKETSEPLGIIPTKEMKDLRIEIHNILDPLWKDGKITRGKIYRRMSDFLKKEYHTASLSTIEEHKLALTNIIKLRNDIEANL